MANVASQLVCEVVFGLKPTVRLGASTVAWALAPVVTHETRPATSPLRRVFGLCRPYFAIQT